MSGAGAPETRRTRPAFETPNAEKYILEADAMRRRQLRSALLHGSSRTWREHRRVWPAVVLGVVVVAIVVAVMAVIDAYHRQQANEPPTPAPTSVTNPATPAPR